MEDSGEKIEIPKFKIKVKGNYADPSVTVSTKGTLNPVDPTSKVVCTAKINNIVSDIENVELIELCEPGDSGQHFQLEESGSSNAVNIKADGDGLKSGKTYKIRLKYELESVPGRYYYSKDITIKPKQTLPKLKTDKSSAYIYAGQNASKEIKVKLTKTSMTGAKITGVKFAKGTPDNIKKAYGFGSYDEENDIMTLKLINPSYLVSGKKYTVSFETECENQMENSVGTTFKLDMTVRK